MEEKEFLKEAKKLKNDVGTLIENANNGIKMSIEKAKDLLGEEKHKQWVDLMDKQIAAALKGDQKTVNAIQKDIETLLSDLNGNG